MNRFERIPFKALELARGQGYLSDKEVCALYALAASLLPRSTVINIGAGMGTSALAFTEAGDNLEVITIDIAESHVGGGLSAERASFAEIGRLPPKQILADSQTLAWEREPVLCVFVDGDHSRAGIEKDLDNWIPNVIPGGFMAFHDYDRTEWPDVKAAIDARMEAGQLDPLFWADTLIVCRVCGEK